MISLVFMLSKHHVGMTASWFAFHWHDVDMTDHHVHIAHEAQLQLW